jgi:hypothetical protein
MKPLGSLVFFEINFGEQLLAAGDKERRGNQGALFEQLLVIANCRNNLVDDVLRDCH